MTPWGELVPDEIRPERWWVLVAHREAAVLFEKPHRRGLRRVFEVERPGGRDPSPEARAAELDAFGRSLAEQLGASPRGFDALVLLAEPRLLGAIRWALPSEISSRVRVSLTRPPAPIDEAEVARFLAGTRPPGEGPELRPSV